MGVDIQLDVRCSIDANIQLEAHSLADAKAVSAIWALHFQLFAVSLQALVEHKFQYSPILADPAWDILEERVAWHVRSS